MLCKPMAMGGLGIRNLGCFNQALLAKQAWRLLKHHESLVARVLMGKYCSKVDFVSSRPKPGCSWGWRSILWGQELLERGLKWCIGDGETASVFDHQWIPKISNPYLSVGLPVGVNNFQVKDLIDWDRLSWRRLLLEVLFPPDIVPNILAIHVSQVKRGDELLWEHTKNGQYSVKSGYFSAYANSFGPLTVSGGFGCWKQLRGLNLPPKYALFLWKMVHRILPVKMVLFRRNLVEDVWCPICKEENESLEHLFFQCDETRRFWRASRLGFDFSVGSPMSVGDWLSKWWADTPDKDAIFESIFIMWGIWCRRNQFVFSNVQDTIEVAVRSTYDAVCMMKSLQAVGKKSTDDVLGVNFARQNEGACQRVVCHAEVGVEVGGGRL